MHMSLFYFGQVKHLTSLWLCVGDIHLTIAPSKLYFVEAVSQEEFRVDVVDLVAFAITCKL